MPQRNSGIESSTIEPISATASPRACRARGTAAGRRRCRARRRSPWPATRQLDRGRQGRRRPGRRRRGGNGSSVPKSPCSALREPDQVLLRQRPIEAHLAGAWPRSRPCVAFGGSDIAAGSTGSRRSTQNSSAETISRMRPTTRRAADQRRMAVTSMVSDRSIVRDLSRVRVAAGQRTAAAVRCGTSAPDSSCCASTQPLPYFA